MTKEEHKQLCKQFWDSLRDQGALDRDFVGSDDFEDYYNEFVEPVDRRVWKEWFSTSNVDLDRRRSLELSGLRYLDPYSIKTIWWDSFVSYSGKMSLIFHIVNPVRRNHYEVIYERVNAQFATGSTKEDPV